MTIVPFLPKARAVAAAAAFTGLSVATSAWAHPGHDEHPVAGFWANLAHLLTEPDHLALIALAVAVAVVARRLQRSRQARRSGSRPSR